VKKEKHNCIGYAYWKAHLQRHDRYIDSDHPIEEYCELERVCRFDEARMIGIVTSPFLELMHLVVFDQKTQQWSHRPACGKAAEPIEDIVTFIRSYTHGPARYAVEVVYLRPYEGGKS
jgi:hypothetical protein